MRDIEPDRCCASVSNQGGFHFHQCTRTRNLIKRKDGLYCYQHDPIEHDRKLQAKVKAMETDWKRREKQDRENKRMKKAYPLLITACTKALEDCNWQVNNQKHLTFQVINELGNVLEKALKSAKAKL